MMMMMMIRNPLLCFRQLPSARAFLLVGENSVVFSLSSQTHARKKKGEKRRMSEEVEFFWFFVSFESLTSSLFLTLFFELERTNKFRVSRAKNLLIT